MGLDVKIFLTTNKKEEDENFASKLSNKPSRLTNKKNTSNETNTFWPAKSDKKENTEGCNLICHSEGEI